jgi:hypothetical protein
VREQLMLYRQARSQYHYKNGPFSIVPNLPGYAIPDHRDHGYGPLARFDDTTLEPGGFVPMHEHRNDEIITYIADGVVRHADSSGARLVASQPLPKFESYRCSRNSPNFLTKVSNAYEQFQGIGRLVRAASW